jgi:hypothetical protein
MHGMAHLLETTTSYGTVTISSRGCRKLLAASLDNFCIACVYIIAKKSPSGRVGCLGCSKGTLTTLSDYMLCSQQLELGPIEFWFSSFI